MTMRGFPGSVVIARWLLVCGLISMAGGCHLMKAARHRAEEREPHEFSCGEACPPAVRSGRSSR
jgi:hypothetical protein